MGGKGDERRSSPGPWPGSGDVLKPRVSSAVEVVAASEGSVHSPAASSCCPGPSLPNVCSPAASPPGRRSLPHFVGPAGGVFPPLIRIHGFSLRFNGGHRDQLALSARPLAAAGSRGPGLRGEGEREGSEGGQGSFPSPGDRAASWWLLRWRHLLDAPVKMTGAWP